MPIFGEIFCVSKWHEFRNNFAKKCTFCTNFSGILTIFDPFLSPISAGNSGEFRKSRVFSRKTRGEKMCVSGNFTDFCKKVHFFCPVLDQNNCPKTPPIFPVFCSLFLSYIRLVLAAILLLPSYWEVTV